MDSTSSSKNNFKFKLHPNESFTRFRNELFDRIIGCNLPAEAKMIIYIVIRYSIGFMQESVLMPNKTLKQFVPVHHSRIPLLVKSLIRMNILKGGPVKTRKDGRVLDYELSVNLYLAEWDVSFSSENRAEIRELLALNQKFKQSGRNKGQAQPQSVSAKPAQLLKPNLQPGQPAESVDEDKEIMELQRRRLYGKHYDEIMAENASRAE